MTLGLWIGNQLISKIFLVNNNYKRIIISSVMTIIMCVFFITLPAQTPSAPASIKTKSLFDAIRSGKTDELNRELSSGADANDSLNGYSALMAAALNGTAEQMKILIGHGANVNYANRDSITALWPAVPDWDKTKLLLDNGANPQLYSKEKYTVLVKLAMMPGTEKIFHLLIDHGADPKKSAPDNLLLYNAASSGDTAILGLLLRSGLKVNDTVAFGDYPINAALIYRSFATLKMLVDNGANINVRPMSFGLESFDGFTPLMFAASNNDKLSFFYLLDHGADPNLRNKKGYTALMLLGQSETDDPEMTRALINHGAVTSVKAPDGSDALLLARRKGNTESVELLKKYANK
jgi:ankyrin repeat protein